MAEKVEKIIAEVEKLSVMELSELVKGLEEKFGVSAMPMMAAGAAPAAGAAAGAEAAEEKSEYQVVLAASGDQKIAVIKAIREIKPDLGLKEAKDLADAAPKELGVMKKEDAEAAKAKLEEAGATVELK
ncbi:MAG: 50S ribosomal protein L7/L12 [Patescibacteria group bacterium]